MRVEGRDELSTTVKRLRTDAGLTQEELAERAGISARTVSDIERGLRVTVYADTARRLAAALGIAPELRAEVESILRGREAPDKGSGWAPLPQIPTPLLGRASELGGITQALGVSDVRLLTLTGPGGIGKTRLAIEAAQRLRSTFEDGIFFVPLDAVRDPALVAPALARALGIAETGDRIGALIERELSRRRALVILDTFEHLVDASPMIAAFVQLPVRTRFLVTSRRPLHIRGEFEFPVPPLELPGALGADAVGDLRSAPATALFVERLVAVDPHAGLDASSARQVLQICRRVNGLPLAIELAAARTKHMPLETLASQLDVRLDVLSRGPADLPERQRTMRETIRWSHDLLPESARMLFRRLAPFSGWDEDALRAANGDEPANDGLDGLSTLVDHSLVVFTRDGDAPRYRMLDVIREYAAECLAESADEAAAVARRHALHYLALAEAAEPRLVRADQELWVRRLDLERANLRAALAWAIQGGEATLAHRFIVALWRYWRHTGELEEGRRWAEAALAVDGDVPDAIRAKALWGTAFIAFPQGDYTRMAELAREDLVVARRSGDAMDLRNALTITGQVALCQGRYADALEPLRESLEICRRLGRSWQLGTSYLNHGNALLRSGDTDAAERAYRDGLAVYMELGDETFAAHMRLALAQTALSRHDVVAAEELAREALRAFAARGERVGVAGAVDALAAIAAANGQLRRSARLDGMAHHIQTMIASRPAPFERAITRSFIDAARDRCDATWWQAAWNEGNALDIEGVLVEAGGEEADPTGDMA